MRILVAESDPALATFLQRGFEAEHYVVDLTADGEAVKAMTTERTYDAAILDLNLSHDEGLEVLRDVRTKQQQLPILILASRTRPEDHAQLLDLGADDLVLKPFAFSELSARVRALLRRGGRTPEAVLRIEDLELSRIDHAVQRAGQKDRTHAEGIRAARIPDAERRRKGDTRANYRARVESFVRYDDEYCGRLH